MSRLLTTLLLYRNGFYVGKYISLEAKIAVVLGDDRKKVALLLRTNI